MLYQVRPNLHLILCPTIGSWQKMQRSGQGRVSVLRSCPWTLSWEQLVAQDVVSQGSWVCHQQLPVPFALRNSVPFTLLWEFITYLLLLLCPGVPMLSCRSHEDPHSCGTACDEKGVGLFFLCPHTCVFQCLQSPVNNTLSAPLQGKTLSFPWAEAALPLVMSCLWLGFSNFCHIPAEAWEQNSTEHPAWGHIRNLHSITSRYFLSSFWVIQFSIPSKFKFFGLLLVFCAFKDLIQNHPLVSKQI